MQDPCLVILENLCKWFGAFKAVQNFQLEVQEGEFITLLGPSGCGKTTALRMIAGQETPSEGRVLIDGNDMTFVPAHRRPVNMVFQSYALFPHMNVFENIAFGPSLKKTPTDVIRKEVTEMLALVQLEGYEHRSVTQLSGGQCQRVALARALINRPKVLLLDEPLGALDLKLRKQMQFELKSLNRKTGTTFVYVTHDQEEALTMSDRIVVMNQGQISQIGSPREIYERPKNTFVSTFIGETNLLKGKLVRFVDHYAEIDLGGITINAPAEELSQTDHQVFLSIRPDVVEINPDKPALENVTTGNIVTVTFLGNLMRYEVRLLNGIVVTVQTNQTSLERIYTPEEEVLINFPVEKLVTLTG